MPLKSWWSIVKQTVSEFSEDNVLRLSAALAYYSIFSIGPLLVIIVGLAGLAFGVQSMRHQIESQLHKMLGAGGAKTIESMMTSQKKGTSLLTTIIGVVVLLVGAGGVFGQLQDSLNTIWRVKTKSGAGLWSVLRHRFLSFSMVLGVGFLLLVFTAISTAVGSLSGSLGSTIPITNWLAHGLDLLVSFAVMTLLFAMIFKYLPDVKVPWRKVWIGAMGTAVLFSIGKIVLGWYLGRQSTTSAYGAAGSVIVILMWVYYASVILFFGAEFTQVYTRRTGAVVQPRHYAVPVTEEERARQGMVDAKKTEQAGQASSAANRPPEPVRSGGQHATAISPVQALQREGLGSVPLLLATGFVAGMLFRFRMLRKTLQVLGKLRRPARDPGH